MTTKQHSPVTTRTRRQTALASSVAAEDAEHEDTGAASSAAAAFNRARAALADLGDQLTTTRRDLTAAERALEAIEDAERDDVQAGEALRAACREAERRVESARVTASLFAGSPAEERQRERLTTVEHEATDAAAHLAAWQRTRPARVVERQREREQLDQHARDLRARIAGLEAERVQVQQAGLDAARQRVQAVVVSAQRRIAEQVDRLAAAEREQAEANAALAAIREEVRQRLAKAPQARAAALSGLPPQQTTAERLLDALAVVDDLLDPRQPDSLSRDERTLLADELVGALALTERQVRDLLAADSVDPDGDDDAADAVRLLAQRADRREGARTAVARKRVLLAAANRRAATAAAVAAHQRAQTQAAVSRMAAFLGMEGAREEQ